MDEKWPNIAQIYALTDYLKAVLIFINHQEYLISELNTLFHKCN